MVHSTQGPIDKTFQVTVTCEVEFDITGPTKDEALLRDSTWEDLEQQLSGYAGTKVLKVTTVEYLA